MSKLTWEFLDSLPDADAIAEALRKAGVKGVRNDPHTCPLACAVDEEGWTVGSVVRYAPNDACFETGIRLTIAETEFVDRFDSGRYRDLEES